MVNKTVVVPSCFTSNAVRIMLYTHKTDEHNTAFHVFCENCDRTLQWRHEITYWFCGKCNRRYDHPSGAGTSSVYHPTVSNKFTLKQEEWLSGWIGRPVEEVEIRWTN